MWKKIETNIYKKDSRYRVDVTVNGIRLRPEETSLPRARTLLAKLRAESSSDPYAAYRATKSVSLKDGSEEYIASKAARGAATYTKRNDKWAFKVILSLIDGSRFR